MFLSNENNAFIVAYTNLIKASKEGRSPITKRSQCRQSV